MLRANISVNNGTPQELRFLCSPLAEMLETFNPFKEYTLMHLHGWTLEHNVFIHQSSGTTITQLLSKWAVCSKVSDQAEVLGTLSEAFKFAEKFLKPQEKSFQVSLLDLHMKHFLGAVCLVAITQKGIVTHYTLSGEVAENFKDSVHVINQSTIAREKQIRIDIKDIDNYPEPLMFNGELLLESPVVLIDLQGNLSVAQMVYTSQPDSFHYVYRLRQGSNQLSIQHYSEIIFL